MQVAHWGLWVLLGAAAAAAGSEAAKEVQRIDRRAVRELERLAGEAERRKLHATARKVREAILRIDPDRRGTRRKLGYRRKQGRWVEDPRRRAAVLAAEDADPLAPRPILKRAREVELERKQGLLEACKGDPEALEAYVLPLLDLYPKDPAIHKALGHKRIGELYVRPELIHLVRRMPTLMREWKQAGGFPGEIEDGAEELRLPGLEHPLPVFRAGAVTLAGRRSRALMHGLLRDTLRCRGLAAHLLQIEEGNLPRADLVVLRPSGFAAAAPEAQAVGRYDAFLDGHLLLSAATRREARARYAQWLARWALGGTPDSDPHAWFRIGLGGLIAYALFGRDGSGLVRPAEGPAPDRPDLESALRFLSTRWLAGARTPLSKLLRSPARAYTPAMRVEVYSFVAFLFFRDEQAAAMLPEALRKAGPQEPAAARAALQAVYRAGPDAIEPLWRAFVLEILGR